MADLYVWSKYDTNSSTSSYQMNTGRYIYNYYYAEGAHTGQIWGAASGSYRFPSEAPDVDGFTKIQGAAEYETRYTTSYSKGSYIGTVTAVSNAYVNNARNNDGYWYVRGGLANKVPVLNLSTEDKKTIYENDTFSINGTATDSDNGNVVTVKYTVAESVEEALTAAVSDGSNAIPFNKTLTFRGGKIYDGDTAVTGLLTDGNAYTLAVWAEDNRGAKSTVQTRTFHVVPNRVPVLTVNDYEVSACIIDTDKFTISGTCSDEDGNTMTVGYRINGGNFVEVYSGTDGNWEFELILGQLKTGLNSIAIEALDSYNFKTSQTITLNKNVNATHVLNSIARYKIVPASGSAKGVLVWIQRESGLTIDCEISMTDAAAQETFTAMALNTTAPVSDGIVEDEFFYETDVAKENIILNVKMNRASVDVNPTIKLISGVLE